MIPATLRLSILTDTVMVNPCSSLRCITVVVWLCVVLVGFCWCCLVEVFSGLVVDLGDDFLEFFLGYGSEVGVCG
ncbi:MAG: hypothetical protein B5766_02140 [Candidatus Lumbricidophila eiseniae]|uniref:Transmembrane protein n=1 Tax=Candidatus Lumbricidiphila eiseniae TaxID=1969409 RepID=A0A2A6FTJ3_9MICO|nr:MAG: hypothetical protein B5766_02140 [Candidatus Lumbricidophila eiseniae]